MKKRLKQNVVEAIKVMSSQLYKELAEYYGHKGMTTYSLADRNNSPKLHEIGALQIMARHLGCEIEQLLYKEDAL